MSTSPPNAWKLKKFSEWRRICSSPWNAYDIVVRDVINQKFHIKVFTSMLLILPYDEYAKSSALCVLLWSFGLKYSMCSSFKITWQTCDTYTTLHYSHLKTPHFLGYTRYELLHHYARARCMWTTTNNVDLQSDWYAEIPPQAIHSLQTLQRSKHFPVQTFPNVPFVQQLVSYV